MGDLKKVLKKGILSFFVACMIICLLTPVEGVKAIEEVADSEVTVLCEDESLREESSKTFIMSDHTKQKVIYSVPVHYQENGEWYEIDNTLIDDGLTYVESVETTEVVDTTSQDSNEVLESTEVTVEDSEENLDVVEENQTVLDKSDETIQTEESSDASEENMDVVEEEQNVLDGNGETVQSVESSDTSEENLEVVEEQTQSNNANDEESTESINSSDENIVVDEIESEEITETDDAKSAESSEEDRVVGYKNKNGNFSIKFSKKVHKKNMVSLADGDYKITWGFKDYVNKSYGVVQPQASLQSPIEEVYEKLSQTI